MGLTSSPEDIVKEKQKVKTNIHVMLVEGMSKLTTHNVNTCLSSDFHMYGLKWNMEIRPAGSDGKKDYLSFYVRIEDTKSLPANWEVECSLKFIVIDQKAAQICHSIEWHSMCYSAKNVSLGIDNFMPHTMLKNGYLVNDKAFFSAEISNLHWKNFTRTYVLRTIGTSERLKLIDIPRNKSRFTWKITQFSSFDGVCHSSYEFTAGPRRWKISMYPKGIGAGKGNSFSLYLEATDYLSKGPKAKTLAVFKLRILDQLHRNHHEPISTNWFPHDYLADPVSCGYGWAKYMSYEDLTDSSRGFLVNDQMYIGVEFLLLSTTEDL